MGQKERRDSRRGTARAVTILATVALSLSAVAGPSKAESRARHVVKHGRHGHVTLWTSPHGYYRADDLAGGVYVAPSGSEYRDYRYGGPLFNTCDRMNADRMLAGRRC
jgi:hypothetical protein